MKKIAVRKPPQKIVEMANKLLKLGFNLDRMSSKSYNLKVLMGFSEKELEKSERHWRVILIRDLLDI